MTTRITQALLLGLLAFAVTSPTEAHAHRTGRADRFDRSHGHTDDRRPFVVARDVRELVFRLEDVTDRLVRVAERATGLPDRHEASALRAMRRLEMSTDELAREARQRELDRGFQKDLARVLDRYDLVRERARALPRTPRLRRDLREADRLVAALSRFDHRRDRIAWHDGRRGRFGWR